MMLADTYLGQPLDAVNNDMISSLIEGHSIEGTREHITTVFTHVSPDSRDQMALLIMSEIVSLSQELSRRAVPLPRYHLYTKMCDVEPDDVDTDIIYFCYQFIRHYPFRRMSYRPQSTPLQFSSQYPHPRPTCDGWVDTCNIFLDSVSRLITVSPLAPYIYAHYSPEVNGVTAIEFLSTYHVSHKDDSSTVKWKEQTFATQTQSLLDRRRIKLAQELVHHGTPVISEDACNTALRAVGFSPQILPGYMNHIHKGEMMFGGPEAFVHALSENLRLFHQFYRVARRRIAQPAIAMILCLIIAVLASYGGSRMTFTASFVTDVGVIGFFLSLLVLIERTITVKHSSTAIYNYTIGDNKKFRHHYNPLTQSWAGEKPRHTSRKIRQHGT